MCSHTGLSSSMWRHVLGITFVCTQLPFWQLMQQSCCHGPASSHSASSSSEWCLKTARQLWNIVETVITIRCILHSVCRRAELLREVKLVLLSCPNINLQVTLELLTLDWLLKKRKEQTYEPPNHFMLESTLFMIILILYMSIKWIGFKSKLVII